MKGWCWFLYLCVCSVWTDAFKDQESFFQDSLHVVSLNEQTYQDMKSATDQIWLVDYYAPWCPHCRTFAPELEKIAAVYSDSTTVFIGAVDCSKYDEVCTLEGVMNYPSIKLYHVPPNAEEPITFVSSFGRKNMRLIVDWMETKLEKAQMSSAIDPVAVNRASDVKNESKTDNSTRQDVPGRPLQVKMARLQDSGAAALFTLEQSLFIGSQTLSGERFEAAKQWVNALAASFPLESNRQVFQALSQVMIKRTSWDQTGWNNAITRWKQVSWKKTIPKTLLLNEKSAKWAHCTTYTCGLWTLFHYMSVQAGDPNCPLKPSQVAASIRLFIKYFFGCEECVSHFLTANPESVITKFAESDAKGNQAIVMWLWKMHNIVNRVTQKPFWPSIKNCAGCFLPNTQTADIKSIREDRITEYIRMTYQVLESEVWDMKYATDGMISIIIESLTGFSTYVIVVVIILMLIAGSKQRRPYGLVFKREHAS